MRNCADLIEGSKAKKKYRSDRELGELFDVSPQAIGAAKRGKMTDPLAMKVADVLELDPGYVLWIARTERERDPAVRMHLEAWGKRVGKLLASVPLKAVNAFAACAVALGMMFSPAHDAQAFGGAGGIRTLDAGFAHILP